jgi:hypothetical protein
MSKSNTNSGGTWAGTGAWLVVATEDMTTLQLLQWAGPLIIRQV